MSDIKNMKDFVDQFNTFDMTKYKTNAAGALIPIVNIPEFRLLEDEQVRSFCDQAIALNTELTVIKRSLFDDFDAFLNLLIDSYGKNHGGQKGNVTLTSFDGLFKVQVAVAENITFGAELQAAKLLIDECINDWTENANSNVKAIIDRAFDVDKEGNISTAKILSLFSIKIDDERWISAMRAVKDAIRVTDTTRYIRFYQKVVITAKWQPILVDFSKV